MSSENFIRGLESRDYSLVRKSAKSDLHNHGILGGKLAMLEAWVGKALPKQPEIIEEFSQFDAYLFSLLDVAFAHGEPKGIAGLEFLFAAAFAQAKEDSVKVLEMSVDSGFNRFYPGGAKELSVRLDAIHKSIAPEMNFIPELGIARDRELAEAEEMAEDFISSGYFKAIDLYGTESAKDAKLFKNIFTKAKNAGMKLKSHAGEYGDAESIRYTAETLELDAIQHGIRAAESKEVMSWLRENKIVLNVCPTSNVILQRAESIKKHQIRALFDAGIKVTVNSDDIMVFNQTVSDEFITLYNNGVFTAKELDEIRRNGLGE